MGECIPSQVQKRINDRPCSECAGSSGLPWISPGVCPQSWPAASAGIVNGITTGYCCPPQETTALRKSKLTDAQ
jgi:hypothetical protein